MAWLFALRGIIQIKEKQPELRSAVGYCLCNGQPLDLNAETRTK